MFVLSMKTTRPRMAAFGVVLGLLLTVMLATGKGENPRVQRVAAGGDDATRVAYLQEKGYTVDPQWTDVQEVTLPAAENVPAGYAGKRLKCFTYATQGGDTVQLYEYNGKIIGTDLGVKG